jgi:mRNA interferase RelE/StbE
MSWTIRISSHAEKYYKSSSHAEKYYKRLDKNLRQRIKKELAELSQLADPLTHAAVKPLTGELRGFYRIRIGNYRLIFGLMHESKMIAVVNLTPRGDAYRQ